MGQLYQLASRHLRKYVEVRRHDVYGDMSSKANSIMSRMVSLPWISNSVYWWRLWSVGRCIFAVMMLTGALLILVGNELYGTWLLAVTGGLVVVSWTGLFRTSYQRSVAYALSPIARSHFNKIEGALDLSAELRLIEHLVPPTDLRVTHDGIVQAMREMVDGRWRLTRRDFLRHVETTMVRRERLYGWRDLGEFVDSDDDRVQGYVTTARKILDEFEAKQRIIWRRYDEERDLAITRMRQISPPKSRESTHNLLIDTLVSISDLAKQQRICIHDNDDVGMARVARGLADSEADMRLVVRKIRRWEWMG